MFGVVNKTYENKSFYLSVYLIQSHSTKNMKMKEQKSKKNSKKKRKRETSIYKRLDQKLGKT